MAKKSKKESSNGSAAPAPQTAEGASATVETKKSSSKKAAAKKTSAKSGLKKPAAKKPAKTAASKATAAARKLVHPSDEEIRLRAYFIAERRVQYSLGGDPANDWIQAREELLAELNPNAGRD